MEFFEKYAAEDSPEISIEYINNVVHFLEYHAVKLGIEDELAKFKSILDQPYDSQDYIFILSEIDALLGSGSAIGLKWIRDDDYFDGIISKAA
jgi:hypothetical protein